MAGSYGNGLLETPPIQIEAQIHEDRDGDTEMPTKRISAIDIQKNKQSGKKTVMITAYDATFAAILDNAGVDVLLVGDSLGMVVQGNENTLSVTLKDMIYHTRAVARGASKAHIVADLPFMSYQVSPEDGLRAAGRLVQEGGAHAVKLEGGERLARTVATIVEAGIPVMGHIGLTPQSIHQMGGFKIQGRERDQANALLQDALALQDAGAYALVLEGMPLELAEEITNHLSIPTIGIGAGPHCDGQVLVCYDLLSMNPSFQPKFVKAYEQLHRRITDAVEQFRQEVQNGLFPTPEHSFSASELTPQNKTIATNPRAKLYSVPGQK